MAFAIYASLLPFNLRYIPLDTAAAEFRAIMTAASVQRISRANYLANLLLFVPVGFALTGAIVVDRSRRWTAVPAALAVIPIGMAVSLTAEFLQLFVPGRVPSRADVDAQTLGCLIGVAVWILVGQELTAWLRAAQNRGDEGRLARLLTAYAVVWVFVNLAPFDITVDMGHLGRRLRSGAITLVPFNGSERPLSRLIWDIVITVISTAPIGMLGLVGWTGRGTRRHAVAALAVGAVPIIVVEAAQIFIRSHAADITDVMFGGLGVALGAWIGTRTLATDRPVMTPRAVSHLRQWAIVALTAWCFVLLAYHWMPYDFTVDPAAVRRKLSRMSLVPFAGYRSGSELRAFNDLLVKLGLSVPFGGIVAVATWPTLTRLRSAAFLIGSAALFAIIEAGQLFLASRVPDPTDVLVGVAGSIAGFGLGRWLVATPR